MIKYLLYKTIGSKKSVGDFNFKGLENISAVVVFMRAKYILNFMDEYSRNEIWRKLSLRTLRKV